MAENARVDGRALDALRAVEFKVDFAARAAGSVLVSFGETRVICAASLERGVPRWMAKEEATAGWMSAEYAMLPYSTVPRKQRDSSKGKVDGRSIEIQRLIGRSLRAVTDLSRLPGHTLWLDCDVLSADGGTRTASITGAWVAAEIAVQRAIAKGDLAASPFLDSVAAISVGRVAGALLLDLCYVEDRDADVDANIVLTGSGRMVEVQFSGEEATFDRAELNALLNLAEAAAAELTQRQRAAVAEALQS